MNKKIPIIIIGIIMLILTIMSAKADTLLNITGTTDNYWNTGVDSGGKHMAVAQSFRFDTDQNLTQAQIYVGTKGGSGCGGSYWVELQTDNSNVPSGTTLRRTNKILVSNLPSNANQEFNFTSTIPVNASTTYWIVVEHNETASTCLIYTGYCSGGCYANGTLAWADPTPNWGTYGDDLGLILTNNPITEEPEEPDCINDTDCPLCQYCNNGTCDYQSNLQDLKNECPINYTACTNPYTRLGTTGFCDGNGACNTQIITFSNIWNETLFTGYGRQIIIDKNNDFYIYVPTLAGDWMSASMVITKIDENGTQLYNITPTGTSAWGDITIDADNNLIVVGYKNSKFYIAKYNETGSQIWETTTDIYDLDYAFGVITDSQKNIYVTGEVDTTNDDIGIIKYDENGTQIWNVTIGNSLNEFGWDIIINEDETYLYLLSNTASYGAGGEDMWLFKMDLNGSIMWNKTYGGTQNDWGWDIAFDKTGNLIIAGDTYSYGAGSKDLWLIKIDENGTTQWNKTYGGINSDGGNYYVASGGVGLALDENDNIYLIGGTNSYGAGQEDIWLIKTNPDGTKIQSQTIGTTSNEHGEDILLHNGYIYITGENDIYTNFRTWTLKYQETYTGTTTNITTGYVCLNGNNINPDINNNCGIWADCITNQTTANEYYTGYLGDGTNTCTDTNWQSSGTTWYVNYGYIINYTEHADECQQEPIPCIPNWTCDIYAECNESNITQCLAVIDTNLCGLEFTGNLSDYDENCTYTPPAIQYGESNDFTGAIIDNGTKIIAGLGSVGLLIGLLIGGVIIFVGVKFVIKK